MHGSTAEICSPGAFGGVVKESEEARLFGLRNEVMIDCQAWYGSLLWTQDCFIIIAAIFYPNRHFRSSMGFGNWYEKVIDGFPLFKGWLHGSGKRCETMLRGSSLVILSFDSNIHQASLSLVDLGKSEDVVGVMHICKWQTSKVLTLQVSPRFQPYRLGTTNTFQISFSHLLLFIPLQSLRGFFLTSCMALTCVSD